MNTKFFVTLLALIALGFLYGLLKDLTNSNMDSHLIFMSWFFAGLVVWCALHQIILMWMKQKEDK